MSNWISVELVVTWLKLSFYWIFGGRLACYRIIRESQTKSAVLAFKNNMWLTKFKFSPDHWITKDFVKMCDKEIYLIGETDKDL